MSTTDQRTADAEATGADRDGWAVPGVDRVAAPSAPAGGAGGGEASTGVGGGADASTADCGELPDPERLSAEAAAAGRMDAKTVVEQLRGTAPGAPAHPVVAAMLTCLEALDGLRGVGVGTLTAREIRLMLLAVVQVIAAASALKLRLLVAGEVQRVADLTGATSTVAFLAHLTQMRRADASPEVRLAKDLDRRYALLAEALAAGGISPEQLRVCVAALRKLPKNVPADQVEACQRFLVEAAQSMDPRQLKAIGRKLWEVIDPDGAEAKAGEELEDEEELARAKAYFRSWRNGDGTTGFRGKLPDLQADMLIKAIQAFASPRRRANPNIPTSQPDDVSHSDGAAGNEQGPGAGTDDGDEVESPEERETGRTIPYPVRLGHGLMDLVERLPADLLPSSGGIAATIVATMRLDQLRSGLGVTTLDTGTEASAGQVRRLACEAGLVPMVLGGRSEPLDVGREQRFHTKPQRVAMGLQQGSCATDGCDVPAAWCHAHHPTPWHEGGETSLRNGALVCPYHHGLLHSTRWLATWTGKTVRFRRLHRSRD